MDKISNYKPLLDAIYMLVAAQLGIYIYSASLPYIQAELHTSQSLVNSTLTAFVFAAGFSQLFIGVLSDKYDNKNIILLMIAIGCISTISISLIKNIHALIFLRGVQGFVAGSLSVLARVILKKNYSDAELVKYIALYAMASTIIPAISPFLGGILQTHFDWRAVFLFMSIYLTLILICFFFTLSKSPNQRSVMDDQSYFKLAFHNYYKLLKSFPFLILTICNAIIFYIEIMELTFSSFILQINYQVSPIQYGTIMVIASLGFIIGSLLVIKGKKFFSDRQLIMIGIYLLFFSSILLVFDILLQWQSMTFYIVAITITNIGLAVAVSPVVAEAFYLYPNMSGSAVAVIGFIQMTGASMLAHVIDKLTIMSQTNFTILIMLMSIILFGLIKGIYNRLK